MAKIIQLYPKIIKPTPSEKLIPEDLIAFKDVLKKDLVNSIHSIVRKAFLQRPRKWMTPRQVQQKMNISPFVLRQLRKSGSLPFCEIDRIIYYDPIDIDREIKRRKRNEASGLKKSPTTLQYANSIEKGPTI